MDESHKFGRHQGRLNTELQRPTEILAHLPLIEVMQSIWPCRLLARLRHAGGDGKLPNYWSIDAIKDTENSAPR